MRKLINRVALLVTASCLLILAIIYVVASNRNGTPSNISPTPSASVNTNVSDVPGVIEVPVDAIPTSEGHLWRISSDSNRQLAQCFTRERITFTGLHTLNYANDIPGAQASVSWVTGVIAPSNYFSSAVQLCVTGADRTSDLTELTPGGSSASATTATNGPTRGYATATGVDGMMLLTFWTQPGAPAIAPSPANVMGFRALALYKLAKMGVKVPEVVACQMVAERPIARVPSEVLAMIKAKYANLAPISILSQITGVVDVRAESVAPHLCLYSDGRQVAYVGKVPTSATQAIEVAVKHQPDRVAGGTNSFVMFAKIPTKGWIIVDEWG